MASMTASTKMDLPAPVSPVSAVSPDRNSRSTASMMAKSRMERWVSMAFGGGGLVRGAVLGYRVRAAAPVELRAQYAEVVVAGRVQQR